MAASGFDPARRLLRIFVLIQIGNGNVSPFASVGNRYCTPNAAVGAGDQGDFAFQAVVAGVGLLTTIRIRFHFAL
ncbi:hypothetical protein D3C79_1023940 [compost metagenome]